MSYNGSGTFLINTAGQPVVSGTVISSTAFNALTADLATGLSTAITKDGQTTVTANIPMSTYKFTGLGAGSAATDSVNLSQVQSTVSKLLNTITGTNTITATASPTLSAYAAGQMFYFVAAGDNTTSVTLNIDGLGAKAVTRDGSTALISGDIKSGEVVVVVYDGTRFQVVSQVNSAGDATFANVSITSALNVGGVSTFTGLITANGGVSGALNGTVGATTPNTGSFTTLTTSSTVTLNGGTANGVLYLNGSKVATSGSALVFDGTSLGVGRSPAFGTGTGIEIYRVGVSTLRLNNATVGQENAFEIQTTSNGPINFVSFNSREFAFTTAGSEQMRLTTTGLGIGTTSPAGRLEVKSSNTSRWWLENDASATNTKMVFADSGGSVNRARYQASEHYFQVSNVTDAAILDSSGNLGIGTASPSYPLHVVNAANGIVAVQGGSSTNQGGAFFVRNAAASGTLWGFGDLARFIGGTPETTATVWTASAPLVFHLNGAERARITSAGNIVAGASAALATNATDGFLYVPTCAGTPTGTPTAITGMAPIVVNTTNNKLYFYSGGAWRDAGP